MEAHAAAVHHEHGPSHPTAGVYLRIGLVLFVLTALEVAAYEVAHREGMALGPAVRSVLIPVLLVLSAAKFALVAMYYMHLKQDSKLLSGVFVASLLIAAVVIVSLIVLMSYHMTYWRP